MRSHVLARLACARGREEELSVKQVLLEATRQGGPTLAAEAGELLDRLGAKAGNLGADPDVIITPVRWDAEKSVGQGSVTVQGHTWRYLDYQDQLPLDECVAKRLQVAA
eukprot:4848353-Pyramimonas_sp.AAC.1